MSSKSSCIDCKIIVSTYKGRCNTCNTLRRVDGINTSLLEGLSNKLQCLCCRNFKSPNSFNRVKNFRGRQKYCKTCNSKVIIDMNNSDDDHLILLDESENDSDYNP